MKKSIIFCLCVAVIALFTACNKDQEGVYNPSKKIQKIYTLDNGAQELEEIWNWDDKLLTSITDVSDNSTSTFAYDSKKRLVSIDSKDSHSEFVYDGKLLQKIVFTENGVEEGTAVFEHEKGKISVITMDASFFDEDDLLKTSKVNPLRFVIPEAVPIVEKAMKKHTTEAKGTQITIKLNWNGDNVKSLQMNIPVMGMSVTETTEFTYDNKNNPIYGSFASMTSDFAEFLFLNKNNPLTMKSTAMGYVLDTAEYTYEYDGNYPTKVTCKRVDDEGVADIETIIYEY